MADKHIQAAYILLKKQFPHISGLQHTILAQTDAWEIMTAEGVQILNDTNKHWVCMSTIGCTANTVNVYDSLNSKASPAVVKQITSILHCQAPSFTIRAINCQGQSGGSDCGLFAIATATSLCHGLLPGLTLWDQTVMRVHLMECFETGELLPFPGWETDGASKEEQSLCKQTVRVFCSCRRQEDNKRKMAQCIQCKEWFHQNCENIPELAFKRKFPFTCTSCSQPCW